MEGYVSGVGGPNIFMRTRAGLGDPPRGWVGQKQLTGNPSAFSASPQKDQSLSRQVFRRITGIGQRTLRLVSVRDNVCHCL